MEPSRSNSSLLANLLLSAGSLALTCLLLALLEGGLRVVGLGAPDASGTSRLKYQQIYPPILVPGERPDGTLIWHTADQRLPFQSILREKTPATLRVFTFGGSATAGLGYSPNVTFARHLERMLRRAHPDRRVELVNLGIVALASRQVKLLVADVCLRFEPDLIAVYSGNNEFLEIHAEKYAAAQASPLSAVAEVLMDTNLYRLVNRAARGPQRAPPLSEQDFSQDDLRLTQDAIIKEVSMAPQEIAAVVNQYEANLEEITRVARETQTPLILMSVGSNWKWRGRLGLPADWLEELLEEASVGPGAYRRALPVLEEKIASSAPAERHEWLFRAAVASEALGDHAAARRQYRAAMNQDPHLRRALDAMNDRVREVAVRNDAIFLDTVEVLEESAEHGIVGFGEYYDYVHFTPRGAVLTAAAIFDTITANDLLPSAREFDSSTYIRERLGRLARLTEDELEVTEWMGLGFDEGLIHDRDLWKYDRMLKELDRHLDESPEDVRALVYRANSNFFRADGAESAARDYEAALALGADAAVVGSNLARLRAERRP